MAERPNRRDMLALSGAALDAPRAALAAPTTAQGIYRKAIVIDGNLVASMLDGASVLDKAAVEQIRGSGLTVMKQTFCGSGKTFAETTQKMDDMDLSISKNASVVSKVVQVGTSTPPSTAGVWGSSAPSRRPACTRGG